MTEKWIRQWEERCGLAPRLSEVFSSPSGQEFLRKARTKREGRNQIDLEVFAFALIFFVWRGEAWQQKPPKTKVEEFKKNLSRARRSSKGISDEVPLGPNQTFGVVRNQIKNWEDQLKRMVDQSTSVTWGNLMSFGKPADSRRNRAKREVVMLLTGYFKDLQWKRPWWDLILNFLVLAGLEKEEGNSAKNISSWWSTTLKRPITSDDPFDLNHGPIKPHQESWVLWFENKKNDVWGEGGGQGN